MFHGETCDCEEVAVTVGEELDPDGIGVLVSRETGSATNRWADGTVGLLPTISAEAEEEVDAWCSTHEEVLAWTTAHGR